MTASFDQGLSPEDRPFVAKRAPSRPRPSRMARVFRWWLGLAVVTFLVVATCVLLGHGQIGSAPLHIVINDDDVTGGITVDGLTDGARALLAFGAAMLALLLLLLLPLLLVLVLVAAAIALVCGIGIPLLVLALALGAVTSPIWMLGLLVWLIARRRDSQRRYASATMAG